MVAATACWGCSQPARLPAMSGLYDAARRRYAELATCSRCPHTCSPIISSAIVQFNELSDAAGVLFLVFMRELWFQFLYIVYIN